MTKTKLSWHGAHGFYRLAGDLLPRYGPYFFDIDGGFLYLTYIGTYFYGIPQFDGSLPKETSGIFAKPRLARFEVGQKQASEFSEEERQVLRGWVLGTLLQVKARVAAHLKKRDAEIRSRIEEGESNRRAKACEVCKDINDPPCVNFNAGRRAYICTCGIRYVYDPYLCWWDRRTLAESEHEHAEQMDAIRYGEPNW
jgi:hypothetical protein